MDLVNKLAKEETEILKAFEKLEEIYRVVVYVITLQSQLVYATKIYGIF